MGIFDYFSAEQRIARKRAGCLKKLTNMYYQKGDRLYAADIAAELAAAGDKESVLVLLARFEHISPSSTIDQEEKRYVHDLLVGLGEPVVETIQTYVRKSQKGVYWPLRVIGSLLSKDAFIAFLADVIENTDTDYWRSPDKKVGLMRMAADLPDPRLALASLPFVADADESVRFQAVEALLAQAELPELASHLTERLAGAEESLRIRLRIAAGFAERGWVVPEEMVEAVRGHLPEGHHLTKERRVAGPQNTTS